jgi:hypothetical protein
MAYGEPDPGSGSVLAVSFIRFDGRSLSRYLKMFKICFAITWAVRPEPKPVIKKKFYNCVGSSLSRSRYINKQFLILQLRGLSRDYAAAGQHHSGPMAYGEPDPRSGTALAIFLFVMMAAA